MICSKCAAEIADTSRFCNECGSPQKAAQGHFLDPEPKSYTPKFLAEKILTSKSAIEGERKNVTVLFADVADYTPLSEKLDPETVHLIMEGCFKILLDQVHEHQGTINQFTGDGIMALFGAPLAIENHAQNACLAAIAIQRHIEPYGQDLTDRFGIDFRMRIGINSGTVVVGSIGDDLRMDYTAIGDTTNLAARMENMARPGKILISSNTFHLVNQFFKLNSRGQVRVKGKAESMAVYEIVRERSYQSRLSKERQIYSEMVGRTKEISRLEIQVNKAIIGEGSVVNVIGDAGIGKSRLIAELKRREAMKQVTLLEGRAISIGKNLSFHPIIDLLKQWAGITEYDSDSRAFGKLDHAIRSIHPDDADEILSFVATLMGLKPVGRYAHRVEGIKGEALEKLIVKNVRELMIKGSALNPTVVIMEDLHWADTSSIEFLENLYRLAENHRILFINVFRPGYLEKRSEKITGIGKKLPIYYVEINLQPLDKTDSEALIQNMLEISGLPYTVIGRIIERAGGNPFFIEEVVRSLIDDGTIIKTDTGYQTTERINNVAIPPTINDVLIARIDRLEERTKELVKIASVIGRSFFDRIIKDVADSIENVDDKLGYLKNAQLIRDRIRMQELEYLFKHALTQEAAYESTLLPQRKLLHLRVASSIEKLFQERLHEFYGMLAYHYNMADESEKAEEFMMKAGDQALRSSASSEALHYFQEALQLYKNKFGSDVVPEKLVRFEKSIALALYNKGMSAEASEYFDKVLISYGVKWPKHLIPSVIKFSIDFLAYVTSLYLPILKWNKAASRRDNEILDLLAKKLTCASITDTLTMLKLQFIVARRLSKFKIATVDNGVEILGATSLLFSWTGLSLKLSKKVISFAKTKDSIKNIESSPMFQFAELIDNYLSGENLRNEKPYNTELVDYGLRMGELNFTTFYTYQSSLRSIERGQYDDAVMQIEKLLHIADVYDFSYAKVIYYAANTKLLMKYRKLNDAVSCSELGIEYSKKLDEKHFIISHLSYQGRMQALLGNIEATKKALQDASMLMSPLIPTFHSNDYYICQFIYDISILEHTLKEDNMALIKKHKKQALLSGKKAVKFSVKKNAADRVEIFRLMGTYYFMINKINKAILWWDKSIKQAEYMGYSLELSRTYYEIGRRSIENHKKNSKICGKIAEEHLEGARNMYIGMNLQWDLDELDKIVSY